MDCLPLRTRGGSGARTACPPLLSGLPVDLSARASCHLALCRACPSTGGVFKTRQKIARVH
eukprot:383070-Pyramimonas_sp.AAC.1